MFPIDLVIFDLINIYSSNHNVLYIIQQSSQHLSTSILLESCKEVSGKRLRMIKHLAIKNKSTIAEYNHASNGRHTDIVTPISKVVDFKDKI